MAGGAPPQAVAGEWLARLEGIRVELQGARVACDTAQQALRARRADPDRDLANALRRDVRDVLGAQLDALVTLVVDLRFAFGPACPAGGSSQTPDRAVPGSTGVGGAEAGSATRPSIAETCWARLERLGERLQLAYATCAVARRALLAQRADHDPEIALTLGGVCDLLSREYDALPYVIGDLRRTAHRSPAASTPTAGTVDLEGSAVDGTAVRSTREGP